MWGKIRIFDAWNEIIFHPNLTNKNGHVTCLLIFATLICCYHPSSLFQTLFYLYCVQEILPALFQPNGWVHSELWLAEYLIRSFVCSFAHFLNALPCIRFGMHSATFLLPGKHLVHQTFISAWMRVKQREMIKNAKRIQRNRYTISFFHSFYEWNHRSINIFFVLQFFLLNMNLLVALMCNKSSHYGNGGRAKREMYGE